MKAGIIGGLIYATFLLVIFLLTISSHIRTDLSIIQLERLKLEILKLEIEKTYLIN